MYLRFLLSGLIIKNILNTSTNSSREYATFDNLFLETQNDPGPWGSYWRVLIWCGFSSSCGLHRSFLAEVEVDAHVPIS